MTASSPLLACRSQGPLSRSSPRFLPGLCWRWVVILSGTRFAGCRRHARETSTDSERLYLRLLDPPWRLIAHSPDHKSQGQPAPTWTRWGRIKQRTLPAVFDPSATAPTTPRAARHKYHEELDWGYCNSGAACAGSMRERKRPCGGPRPKRSWCWRCWVRPGQLVLSGLRMRHAGWRPTGSRSSFHTPMRPHELRAPLTNPCWPWVDRPTGRSSHC